MFMFDPTYNMETSKMEKDMFVGLSLSSRVNGTSGSRNSQTPFMTEGSRVGPGRRRKVIPAYICAASIWTYDGNNLEALGARRTYVSPARACTEPPAPTGMYSGCDGDGGIRRDEYGGVCATMEGAKPQ